MRKTQVKQEKIKEPKISKDDLLKSNLRKIWKSVRDYEECLAITMAAIFEEDGKVEMTKIIDEFKKIGLPWGAFDTFFKRLQLLNRSKYDGKVLTITPNLFLLPSEMKDKK